MTALLQNSLPEVRETMDTKECRIQLRIVTDWLLVNLIYPISDCLGLEGDATLQNGIFDLLRGVQNGD